MLGQLTWPWRAVFGRGGTCPRPVAEPARWGLGALRLLLVCLAALAPTSAGACKYQRGYFLQIMDGWRGSCRHPLCGTIYSPDPARLHASGSSCDGDAYVALANEARELVQTGGILLLGEVHDNGEHHKLRAAWLQEPAQRGDAPHLRPAALVFEHIRADQQQALAAFGEFARNGQHIATAANLFRFLKWDESGWPDKAKFEPLFKVAIDARHPILAGDPSRDSVRGVARGGISSLADDERERLQLAQPLPAKLQNALLDELEASHCGLVPKATFASMADAQRFRDAHLADVLAKAAEKHGNATLLAGNGHVRADRAVPYHLRRLAPGRKVVSVAFLEVADDRTSAAAYVPRDPDGRPAADYIIFTPRAERKDPCTEMRERFGKGKAGK